MNKFTQKLQAFMQGRYGADQLTLALLISSIIISFITAFIRVPFLPLLSYVPLIFGIYRTLSKNRSKRYNENRIFMNKWTPIQRKLVQKKNQFKERKTHKYYKCKACGKMLRVPKGKGNIRITCPACKHSFSKRT